MLDYTIRIGSTPTFLYFDLYLYSAYATHYIATAGLLVITALLNNHDFDANHILIPCLIILMICFKNLFFQFCLGLDGNRFIGAA